jgi:hypothetical protein
MANLRFCDDPQFFGTVGESHQMEAMQMCLIAPMLKLEQFDLARMRPLFRDNRSDPLLPRCRMDGNR